eukprot:TRINITY_DN1454_c0_g1_i1.p1 TRINITY_DN1454_c0_g1~~TRINITY_DN1454_c0_g1_i1.p1  ORF type:complete len:124 (+),score=6.22 TRINITY_DN1454_c0_g1_i1:133-504(+)
MAFDHFNQNPEKERRKKQRGEERKKKAQVGRNNKGPNMRTDPSSIHLNIPIPLYGTHSSHSSLNKVKLRTGITENIPVCNTGSALEKNSIVENFFLSFFFSFSAHVCMLELGIFIGLVYVNWA